MKSENNYKIMKIKIFFFLVFLFGYFGVFAQQRALTPQNIEDFKIQTKYNIGSLQNCITTIGSKSSTIEQKYKAIKNACNLFIPDAEIEVSSLYKKLNTFFKVPKYFKRLSNLRYTEIKVSFYDMSYVAPFEQAPDGNFYSVVRIYQKFQGYQDGKIVYEDVSSKDIEVCLQWREDEHLGTYDWILRLGNMTIKETKTKYEDLQFIAPKH